MFLQKNTPMHKYTFQMLLLWKIAISFVDDLYVKPTDMQQ